MTAQNLTLPPAIDPGLRTGGGIDYERLSRRGHRLRSEAIAAAAKRLQRYINNRVFRPLQCWREERLRYSELMSLDSRTLKDIGISRGDIRAIASGTWADAPKRRGSVRATRLNCVAVNAAERQDQVCPDEWAGRLAA